MKANIRVTGTVQGVGFRPFIYRTAVKNRLAGFVRNHGDASVEIVVQGNEHDIKDFLNEIDSSKPPLARIQDIKTTYDKNESEGKFENFSILKSSRNLELSGSVIPPDVSICNECLNELKDPENIRHNYFFITCTDCGPRYTITNQMPYDRLNTTMKDFAMCPFCLEEYSNPTNRRFHAQTIACPECGPKVSLATNDGKLKESKDPIRDASKLLKEGSIVAIKGLGGFHVATATTKSEPIARLRTAKHRAQKPFAIMARDMETVRSFADVSQRETEMLTSYVKPIVLLKKNDNYYLSELIAPGLHNVGVMLPYSGLHYLMFEDVKEPAFIMTSANPPNEPIVIENDDAVKKLGDIVDYFLFHNRLIAQRCDDSVVRVHERNTSLVRRSRGYAPEAVQLERSFKPNVLGVGAELNAASCILTQNKAFLSQYVGDIENLETFLLLRKVTDHLMHLTNTKVEAISCDLHPKFATTRLAHEIGEKLNCPVNAIQHHHAHAAALMAEHGVEEMVAIVCDGYGFGSDGTAWGGEIFYCDRDEGFQRVGHLQTHSMIGGDLTAYYPLRMAAGILNEVVDVEEWLHENEAYFPHGGKEVEIIIKQMKNAESMPQTSSCGRVLDAAAAILGICYERSYEGEPAMKLESAAIAGKNVLKLDPLIRNNVVDTTSLVYELFENRKTFSVVDLAFSAQHYLANSLAELAVEEAERLGIKTVGFSGGVAYNESITSIMRNVVEKNRKEFIVHETLPAGDGCISVGQAAATALQIERKQFDD